MHILVVEDDQNIREVLAEVLKSEGYEVTTAENGASAQLLLCNGCHPNVIILDLLMPVVDGWEFLREKDRFCSGIPIIVMSAACRDLVKLVPYPMLRKPIDVDESLDSVKRQSQSKSA
jgi:CheY-like chemotaxis protein